MFKFKKIKDLISILLTFPKKFLIIKTQLKKPPIVIGGCGRSGTTLLLSILSAHPRIHSIKQETYALIPIIYSENYRFLKKMSPKLKICFHLLKENINRSCYRWCEKTPRNVLFYDYIIKAFKNKVKILNMVRDGRDVILSKHPKNPSHNWTSPQRWIRAVKEGLKFKDHPNVLTIKYEDLILNFDSTIRKICLFLNEECNKYILNWYKYTRIRSHPAWQFQKIEKLHDKSIGKWKNNEYKNYIENFLKNSEAYNLLRKLDYIK